LRHATAQFTEYTYLDRGSDERQYCSAKVNLPVASVMRSKYWCYPEYHTSLDDLTLISPAGLAGSFEVYRQMISILENNWTLDATIVGEPFLQKHQLFSVGDSVKPHERTRLLLNLLAYADGRQDLISLAETIGVPALDCIPVIARLRQAGLLQCASWPSRPAEADVKTLRHG
jgi:aminopeptidase-like protein